jgi:hypothetical protein
MTGRTLSALAHGRPDGDPRVVLSEGRGTHGLIVGNYRLLTREGKAETIIFGDKEVAMPEELFDLTTDPGERRNLLKSQPAKAAEMKARLDAAIHGVPTSGSVAAPAAPDQAVAVALRFAGRGAAHRVSGYVSVDGGATLTVTPVGIAASSLRGASPRVELAFASVADAVVGLDVRVDPPGAPVHWELFVDDQRLAPSNVFAGPFGLAAPLLVLGVTTDEARTQAFSPKPALVDPRRDFGLFVTRERGAEPEAVVRAKGAGGTAEMTRLMREWGYAHDKADLAH